MMILDLLVGSVHCLASIIGYVSTEVTQVEPAN